MYLLKKIWRMYFKIKGGKGKEKKRKSGKEQFLIT